MDGMARNRVIVRPTPGDAAPDIAKPASALAASGVFHFLAAGFLLLLAWRLDVPTPPPEPEPIPVEVRVPVAEERQRFDNEDIGRDPNRATNFNVERNETVSVPASSATSRSAS